MIVAIVKRYIDGEWREIGYITKAKKRNKYKFTRIKHSKINYLAEWAKRGNRNG